MPNGPHTHLSKDLRQVINKILISEDAIIFDRVDAAGFLQGLIKGFHGFNRRDIVDVVKAKEPEEEVELLL